MPTKDYTYKEVKIFSEKDKGICSFNTQTRFLIQNFITNIKSNVVNAITLSGHKSIRMLQRYSHTDEKAKKTAINKLGKNLTLRNIPEHNRDIEITNNEIRAI